MCVADEQSYTLRDAEAEVLFGFSLEESLKRAHSAPLFKVRQQASHSTQVDSETSRTGPLITEMIGKNDSGKNASFTEVILAGWNTGKTFHSGANL